MESRIGDFVPVQRHPKRANYNVGTLLRFREIASASAPIQSNRASPLIANIPYAELLRSPAKNTLALIAR
jgi:hypothetical protein